MYLLKWVLFQQTWTIKGPLGKTFSYRPTPTIPYEILNIITCEFYSIAESFTKKIIIIMSGGSFVRTGKVKTFAEFGGDPSGNECKARTETHRVLRYLIPMVEKVDHFPELCSTIWYLQFSSVRLRNTESIVIGAAAEEPPRRYSSTGKSVGIYINKRCLSGRLVLFLWREYPQTSCVQTVTCLRHSTSNSIDTYTRASQWLFIKNCSCCYCELVS